MGNYLGRGLDKISNIEILDNLVFDNSSSYSITKGSVAFTPNSAQSLLISIDGVVNATNFTVNGSTIDFGVAVPSTSVCNFFLHYGTGVMTVPSDGSVTTAKLGNGAVTSAKLSSGKVLQVVSVVDSTDTSITTATYTDTGLSANITPISTSSKVLVIVNHAIYLSSSTTNIYGGYKLLRGSTDIFNPNPNDGNGPYGLGYSSGEATSVLSVMHTTQFLDSPSSTAQQSYKTQGRVYIAGSGATIRFNYNAAGNNGKSVMTLMEVAG